MPAAGPEEMLGLIRPNPNSNPGCSDHGAVAEWLRLWFYDAFRRA